MNVISKLQKLLQPDKKIAVDKEKNSIVVKNIDNSSVYINPLDQEDLEQLRKDIQADQYELFDQLIEKLILTLNHDSTPKIRHFFRMAELKSSTDNHRFIFENDLAYFTPEEIESHHLIVDHIQEYRSALLLGYPATGKSFAVVDIAEKLALKGYRTYYFSFKKLQYWPEIWSEIKNHADPQTVFVLDDIHLQPETAGTTLNRLRHDEKLNVLFVSREVYKNRNFADTINIYTELKSTTVRTEQPSIDKKVKGIVQLYQSHFQKANQASYPIGDITKITQKVHRNLIVLNAYLRLWEKFPRLTLGELQEKDLYEDIYSTYFEQPNIDEDIRVPLLQYLCLYYFEVEFYRNPSEKEATKILIEKGIITKEEQDLYSIYHGEYALLLLKAYRFVQKRQFKRLGDNWEDFFVNQIKTYILGFKDRSSFPYPENLLEILVAIPRLTREVYGGIKDANIIFKKLIESPEIQPLLIECCEEEEDEQNIAYFLFSITRNAPHLLELFYKTFGEKVFDSAYAIGTYAHTYQVLAPLKQLAWLEDYCKPNISKILKSSSLNKIGSSLSSLAKFFPKEARFLLQSISINELVAKTQDARINDIGNALNELKNIDVAKTRAVYESIKVEVLREKMASARIHGIGKALNELKNIDFSKTQSVYAEIEVKVLREKIANARIHEIGQALNQLKNIDEAKTQSVYARIEDEVLREKIANARIREIGYALNSLKNIDLAKTRAVYESLEVEVLREKIANARIHDIGNALNELKNIDVAKTRAVYESLEVEVLRGKIANARIRDIGHALNELKNIDFGKTQSVYKSLEVGELREKITNARIRDIGHALNELKNIDFGKTQSVYKSLEVGELREKITNARIRDIGHALNELKNIDFGKTQSVYKSLEVGELREKITNARLRDIGQALNQLKNIDVAKTRAVYESLEVEVLREKIANARIHDIGKALNELKNIGVAKTRAVYESLEVEVLREKIANARIHDIGEALNELKNIGVAKTQSIYAGIEEEVLRKKITNARINDISKAFNELGGINLEKTITLCENSMDYILPGVQNTRLHYSNLIYVVSSLSRISPKIGKELYKSIAKEKLFQFDKLGNIYAFNLLAQYLLNIKLDTKDKNFKKVIASGVNQAHRFLKYRELSAVGTYINVMSRLKQNLALQLKKNLKLHTSRILKKENQQYLPRFIAGVFMHSSKLAINNLLMSYQIAFPDDKETVLKTYIEIAKNNLQVEQEKTAMVYLKKAHKIVKSLEEPSYQESIAEVLKEYDLSF